MTAWLIEALLGSAALMLLVLSLRMPVRHAFGPGIAYAMWALPLARFVMPPFPGQWRDLFAPVADTGGRLIVFVSGRGTAAAAMPTGNILDATTMFTAAWAIVATVVFAGQAIRHIRVCRRLIAAGTPLGTYGVLSVIATDVDGPIAFGVHQRFIAVPRDFEQRYDMTEQALALAHEHAHHARGDLAVNWLALGMLSLHWFNPIAWIAIRAFSIDQEFAVDAQVLAGMPTERARYARLLARASGLRMSPACRLHSFANLKGRLIMLSRHPRSTRRHATGAVLLSVLGLGALAATASGAGAAPGDKQAHTIVVRPTGGAGYTLIVGGTEVAPGAALPGGLTLPADFAAAGGCKLTADAAPTAMVLKGAGGVQSYTVMCAGARTASARAAIADGLASLRKVRGMVATQPASAAFPEAERHHALGAIDVSIGEMTATLAEIE